MSGSSLLRIGFAIPPVYLVFCSGAVAHADIWSTDVSVAYSFARETREHVNYPVGGSIAATQRIHRWLGAVAEVAVNTRTADFSQTQGGTFDIRYESLQVGPRVCPLEKRARPYLQVLAGATRWRVEERGSRFGPESSTHFSLQPGVGVDALLSQRVAVRIGADLNLTRWRDNRFGTVYWTKLYRLHLGFALALGRR